jgi:hypothetical protein
VCVCVCVRLSGGGGGWGGLEHRDVFSWIRSNLAQPVELNLNDVELRLLVVETRFNDLRRSTIRLMNKCLILESVWKHSYAVNRSYARN